jgi:hypothetical protein
MPGVAGQVGQECVQADQVRADLLPVVGREQLTGDQAALAGGQQARRDGVAEGGWVAAASQAGAMSPSSAAIR